MPKKEKRQEPRPFRLLCYGDTHCGHRAGLTPPGFQQPESDGWGRNQRTLWNWFEATVEEHGPYDLAVHNGDAIDGPGKKSGGSEQIYTSETKQLEMAQAVVRAIPANKHAFVYGTGYHTGTRNDYEANLAQSINAQSASTLNVEINGVTFNFRHHTGRSSIPYGMSAVAKERMWDALLDQDGAADIYIRSHVHQHRTYGDGRYLAMTLPALQGPGSKFGRRCSGDYAVGFVVFDIWPNGEYRWRLVSAAIPQSPERLTLKF